MISDATHPRSVPFDEYFEIERTSSELLAGGYKRIALQFPDDLLRDSVDVYQRLKRSNEEKGHGDMELYVLADTSYGSCCVDEVAAQHVDADAIVHYGYACLSRTCRMPVIYVFGREPVDVAHCVTQLVDAMSQDLEGSIKSKKRPETAVEFRCDVGYAYQAEAIVCKLREQLRSHDVSVLYSTITTRSDPPQPTNGMGQPALDLPEDPSLEGRTIVYVGGESLGLTNLLLTHASSKVYSYDPQTKIAQLQSARTNKLLMRRYAAVQKARDADVFGILVGTLGVGSYLPLIAHIRELLSRAHKKSYTISVGKLNPAKLANFMEVECFVLVACPENSVVESKEFFRPIVTPYELETALRPDVSWTGRYVLDFEELLAAAKGDDAGALFGHGQNDGEDDNRPVFSLTTGKYRHPKHFGDTTDNGNNPQEEGDGLPSSAVTLRNQEGSLSTFSESSAAVQFLQSRTYKGLDARLWEDSPSTLEEGRSGIPREYQDDDRHKLNG